MYSKEEKRSIRLIYKSIYKEQNKLLSDDDLRRYFRDVDYLPSKFAVINERVQYLLEKEKHYEKLLCMRTFASTYIRKQISEIQEEIFSHLRDLERIRLYIEESFEKVKFIKKDTASNILADNIESILSEIKSLKEQYPDTFEMAGQHLIYTTNEITLTDRNNEDYCLGRFEVKLRLGNRNYHVTALDPNPCAGNSSITHPHVNGNRMCEGDAAESISFALREFRLCDFFDMVSGVLNNYGSDNPYANLEDWEGSPCQSCNDTVSNDDSFYCESCEVSPLCSDCVNHCEPCGQYYCSDCMERCCDCRDRFCTSCINRCSDCSDYVCESCDKECSKCGDRLCNDCAKSCEHCGEDYCQGCYSECESCGTSCCPCLIKECENCGYEVCDDCIRSCRSCKKEICNKCGEDCGTCDIQHCGSCLSKCCDCGEDLCEKCSVQLDCSHNVSCDCCATTCDCGNSNCKECTCSCKGDVDGPEIIG